MASTERYSSEKTKVCGIFCLKEEKTTGWCGKEVREGKVWVAIGHGSCSLPFPLHPALILLTLSIVATADADAVYIFFQIMSDWEQKLLKTSLLSDDHGEQVRIYSINNVIEIKTQTLDAIITVTMKNFQSCGFLCLKTKR